MTETTPAERSAAFDDALQNAGHALMLPDPVAAMARVLTTFRDEYRAELLGAVTVPAPAPTDFELRGTGEIRAAAIREAADFLRDAHFDEGLSVQEIGTAMRHWADRERANEASGPGRAASETQQDDDVDPAYNPQAWETYRRDAGCGCTAPAPVDCKVPHGTGAWLCVCHRLSGPPFKESDRPGTSLSSEDEAIRRHFQEPNRCLSANGIFRCSRPTGHPGDHRTGRTFWGRRAESEQPAAVSQPETEA